MERPTPTIKPPVWVDDGRPRVLVESASWAEAKVAVSALEEAGVQAASCYGPEGLDLSCPLVDEDGCTAAKWCNAIVFLLRVTDERNLGVLRELRRRFPGKPVVVCAPQPAIARLDPPLDDGVIVLDYPASFDDIVHAVREALIAWDVIAPA